MSTFVPIASIFGSINKITIIKQTRIAMISHVIDDNIKKYDANSNETTPFLSIYEKTSMIGLRLSQIAYGAQSVLSPEQLDSCTNIKEIVQKEFETRKIPLMVKRVLPNKKVEYWKIEDMIIVF